MFIQKQKILGIQKRHVALLLNLLYRLFVHIYQMLFKLFKIVNIAKINVVGINQSVNQLDCSSKKSDYDIYDLSICNIYFD